MKLRLTLLAAVLGLTLTASAQGAYPNSIASTGDSITRAFNDCWFPYVDCPSASWSTGTSSYSQYRRIQAVNLGITGRSYNHAVTGADMADLYGQVQGVIGRHAEYVTILMGANDVCASSEAGMTDVAVFRDQFNAAMASLTASLPGSRVFVSSIPDIYQLFSLYRYDLGANTVWAVAGICQSMLAYPFSNLPGDVARRARVRQRNIDYNTELEQVCSTYVQCRFDGNAVFNTAFVRSDVSTRDYFHPSVNGQAKLAAVTWSVAAGFVG
jgi:GDSL-like lipase/acylhydrolase family protein